MPQYLSTDPYAGDPVRESSLPPNDEKRFQSWYGGMAKRYDLDPDPDAPEHFYDYRAAFQANATPDETGHWPSVFKREGHPRMVIDGVNTKTGESATEYLSTDPMAGERPMFRTENERDAEGNPVVAAPEHPHARVGRYVTEAAQGFGAAALKLPYLGGDLIRRGLGMERVIDTPEAQAAMTAPDTPAGQAGFAAEQIAEFLVPFGAGAKAASMAPRGLRLGARMLGEGAEAAAKTTLQTGAENPEDLVTAALIGGAAPPVLKAAKAVGKGVTQVLPEKLYTQVFKLAEDDWEAAINAAAKGTAPDKTLAREVMERGIFGSSSNMAIYTTKKLAEVEQQVQHLVSSGGTAGAPRVTAMQIPLKQEIIGLLQSVDDQFKGSVLSDTANMARKLRFAFEKTPGEKVLPGDALQAKRFFDGLRQLKSFRNNPQLSQRQEELKKAANLIRGSMRNHPQFAKLMDEESVLIQARDALIKDAVKRQNQSLLNLMDVVIANSMSPASLAAAGTIRAARQPFALTSIGQKLHRLGQITPEGTADVSGRLGIGAGSVGNRQE